MYVGFFHYLRSSHSQEVRILVNMVKTAKTSFLFKLNSYMSYTILSCELAEINHNNRGNKLGQRQASVQPFGLA